MNKTTVNIRNVNFNLNMADKGGFIKVKTLRVLSVVMIIIAIFSMTVTVSFANVCGGEYGDYKAPTTPILPDHDEPSDDETDEVSCDHICHSTSPVMQVLWNILNFIMKLFGMSPICPCGARHY